MATKEMKTIIYLTDNTLDEKILKRCQDELLKVAGDMPIISVSQKPIDLGKNVCVGDIGRSWLSLYKQELAGLKEAKTKYITIAEHDCLYTREHLDWMPPRDDTFYYNENVWMVQYCGRYPEYDGMYSSFWSQRLALSQLVCDRELLIGCLEERLKLFDKGMKYIKQAGEPGVSKYNDLRTAYKIAKSGESTELKQYIKEHLDKYKYETFMTEIPNLDIRHSSNFTGPRRGKNRCFELPYWGKFEWQ